MEKSVPDDQDRRDRFTWHDGDVVFVAAPNARGHIIEVGQRVTWGEKQGVVEQLTGGRTVVVATDNGQSHTVALDEVEPTA